MYMGVCIYIYIYIYIIPQIMFSSLSAPPDTCIWDIPRGIGGIIAGIPCYYCHIYIYIYIYI